MASPTEREMLDTIAKLMKQNLLKQYEAEAKSSKPILEYLKKK